MPDQAQAKQNKLLNISQTNKTNKLNFNFEKIYLLFIKDNFNFKIFQI